jgi:hypothetical protein
MAMASPSSLTTAPGDGPGSVPPSDYIPPASADGPAPGELHIKNKRSWKTWQLVVAIVVALLFGMWVNYDSGGSAPTTSTEGTLPPPAAPGATTTVPPSGPHAGSNGGAAKGGTYVTTPTTTAGTSTTPTTTAGTSTTPTTGAGTSTTPTTAPGTPLQLLLPATQMKGNWTSPSFTTTAAPWNIGWAFQCTPAPVSGPSLQIYVAPVGGKPAATPAVTETGASGQSISTASSIGAQVLQVKAPANCEWAVKVTGS